MCPTPSRLTNRMSTFLIKFRQRETLDRFVAARGEFSFDETPARRGETIDFPPSRAFVTRCFSRRRRRRRRLSNSLERIGRKIGRERDGRQKLRPRLDNFLAGEIAFFRWKFNDVRSNANKRDKSLILSGSGSTANSC